MDGGDLGLERIVDEPVPGQQSLLLKLGADDDGVEGLAATAGHVLNLDVGGVYGRLELQRDALGRHAAGGRGERGVGVGLGGHRARGAARAVGEVAMGVLQDTGWEEGSPRTFEAQRCER